MIGTESLDALAEERRTQVFESPHTVHLGLSAGERVPEHTHPGRAILFVVQDGRVELTVGGETATLAAGDLARFDGDDDISIDALSDARALVVLAAE